MNSANRFRITGGLAAALLALSFTGTAYTDEIAKPVPWEQLSREQQEHLQRLKPRWNSLSTERQQDLLQTLERWEKMTPAQRTRVKASFERWRKYTPEEKARLRKRREFFNALPPEQQKTLRERYKRFQTLPASEKRDLRRRQFERRRQYLTLPPETQQAIRECNEKQSAGADVNCDPLWPVMPASRDVSPPADATTPIPPLPSLPLPVHP